MNSTEASKEAQQRYWLISTPRTASTMLVKILNLDEQGVRKALNGGYFFLPSIRTRFTLHTKPATEWTDEDKKTLNETMQQCFDSLQDYLKNAEEQKQHIFVKEHALLVAHPLHENEFVFGAGAAGGEIKSMFQNGSRSEHNKTVHTDEFLKTWKPTFVIRHPAMIFSSMYRMSRMEAFSFTGGEPHQIQATLHWARCLYNFYEDHYKEDSQWPLVLDADDVMQHPEIVAKYARLAGLNPDNLLFSWGKMSQEELDKISKMEQSAQSFLYSSNKVDLSKVAGDIDIDAEAVKWKEEFGEKHGANLERLVRANMDDYEYMRARRLTLD